MVSVQRLVDYLLEHRDTLNVKIVEDKDVLLVDAGVYVKPGFLVGKYLSEISMCGLAEVQVQLEKIGELTLPKVRVSTDYPQITLLSQYAAWVVRDGDNVLYLSGPGRIVARKPKRVFEDLASQGVAIPDIVEPVLVCECNVIPSRAAVENIVSSLKSSRQPVILLTSNMSYAGVVQTCARVIEVCMLRLYQLKFNIACVKSSLGCTAIPPASGNLLETSALCNDSILYTGQVLLLVDLDNLALYDNVFRKTVRESNYSFLSYVRMYGEEFLVKIDPDMFRIAELTVLSTCGSFRKYGIADISSFLRLTLGSR